MTTSFFTLEQMDAVYKIEPDWLFEKHPDIHICYMDIDSRNIIFIDPIFREWLRRGYFGS